MPCQSSSIIFEIWYVAIPWFQIIQNGPYVEDVDELLYHEPWNFPLFCIDPSNWKFTFTPQITFFYCNFPLISTAWGVTTINRHIFVSKLLAKKNIYLKVYRKTPRFNFHWSFWNMVYCNSLISDYTEWAFLEEKKITLPPAYK